MAIKQYSLYDLAILLDAQLLGDGNCLVLGVGDTATAAPGQITFIAHKKYIPQLATSAASAVLLKAPLPDCPIANQLIVADPYLAYAKLTKVFDNRPQTVVGVHPSAVVDATATLGENVKIAAGCVIEAGAIIGSGTELCAGVIVGAQAVLGDNCLLHANTTIAHHCVLGRHVKVHSGTTIGSDGFGYAPSATQGWVKIHQLGRVVIGDNVEIGANCAIDRGAIKDTQIANGVIIDNLVHIAHNVTIGEQTAIAGCVGIAGSTNIGARCTIGGFVAVSGHLNICNDVHFNGATVVIKSIDQPGHYASGSPMQDVRSWRRYMVRSTQLDEMAGRIKKLEK
ncbi:UDP-3-O-(3-hydroxymyristoyl)glucosamine N-acyltransferase [Marinagarivorans algicola]|uniref:UDP-3-O-(3-hydroxymyristoyl)glucosamine N-acyltransferase n=1 Tax=Marinagarivorans algicola TaxID=1513270 RepID=UPI0006B52FAC|nr:UDP-3-O-(3-hydroxymyristoyl)glucosamine N-acyltransferase [Marinagarivorans algicola]